MRRRVPGAAQHDVVRCRPGIVTNAELAKVPDLRCTAARCTASGTKHIVPATPQRPSLAYNHARKNHPPAKKGGEAPKGACQIMSAQSAAARHSRGRARLPAPHRGTHDRLSPRWLCSRTGFSRGAAPTVFCRFAARCLELSTLRADRSFCRPTGDPEPPGTKASCRSTRIKLQNQYDITKRDALIEFGNNIGSTEMRWPSILRFPRNPAVIRLVAGSNPARGAKQIRGL
jgi:hypothetical protein